MKVDILAFGAHPDDIELCCAGTILKHIAAGYTAGIIDLTRGELGTRGSAEIRDKEAENSAKILGVSFRENLKFEDGFFENSKQNQLKIIQVIRRHRPEVILANAISDRHPDHGRAATLVAESAFLSGLKKIITHGQEEPQQPWRPVAVYHYLQAFHHKPDFVVDITDHMDRKMEAIRAFKSQFHDPGQTNDEPATFISQPGFMDFILARAVEMGSLTGAKYAEGFTVRRMMGVDDIMKLR